MKVVRKKSPIHRWGLFAKRYISKDERIIEYEGQLITPVEAELRERLYSRNGITYLFEISPNKIIDGGVKGNISKYINHSCDPNCVPETKEDRLFIKARAKVSKGEELTIDYRFNSKAAIEACNCQSPNCRGRINL